MSSGEPRPPISLRRWSSRPTSGSANDIHPPNKNDVGRRLALAARSLAYGDNAAALSPLPTGAKRTARGYLVSFTRPLQALSGPRPLGFELCAVSQASCRYAEARIEGNSVLLSNDGRPATRVRYAWSDYPILNLYSGELPGAAVRAARRRVVDRPVTGFGQQQ